MSDRPVAVPAPPPADPMSSAWRRLYTALLFASSFRAARGRPDATAAVLDLAVGQLAMFVENGVAERVLGPIAVA